MATAPLSRNPVLLSVPSLPAPARLRLLRVFFGDRLTLLKRFADGGQEIVGFRFARRYVVFLNEARAVGEVLLEKEADYHKGPALSIYSRPLLGNGLLTSEEGFHRRQRRLVAPAFAHRRVVSYAAPMAEAAEQAQARWQHGQVLDIAPEMTRLTLAIVGQTLFNAPHIEDEADELGSALTAIMNYFLTIVRSPIRLPFSWIPPWEGEARAAIVRLNSTILKLIHDRRACGRDEGDLLSMLLLAQDTEDDGAGMTDTQIRDELMTLFLAGHETTANALIWTWYLLAKHPEIYRRLQDEVDTALAGRTPTYADLERMPYTLQVLKESMRLYPPAYAIVRQAIRDTEIAGRRVPRKAIVLISPYMLHRRPDYFADPERFDPDRWTPEADQRRPRYAYLPFGGGPRICVGAAFAQMEGHLILAALAQRVTFSLVAPDREVVPDPVITLRPQGAVSMRVTRR